MNKTIENPYAVDSEEIEEAARILDKGGIILYPSDTVWGLGCDATNKKAVSRIFEIKKRTDSKSLVTLASDMEMISQYVNDIPSMAETLTALSDKPLTIIYPGVEGLAPNVMTPDFTAAIRIPQNEFCLRLLKRFRKPIVSTSANISGESTPASYEEISGEIISSVDWCADPIYEEGATGQASSIIKLGLSNEVTIIRK